MTRSSASPIRSRSPTPTPSRSASSGPIATSVAARPRRQRAGCSRKLAVERIGLVDALQLDEDALRAVEPRGHGAHPGDVADPALARRRRRAPRASPRAGRRRAGRRRRGSTGRARPARRRSPRKASRPRPERRRRGTGRRRAAEARPARRADREAQGGGEVISASPSPAWGGGPPEGWWRGRGGASEVCGRFSELRAGYPSTMLRMVPLPTASRQGGK